MIIVIIIETRFFKRRIKCLKNVFIKHKLMMGLKTFINKLWHDSVAMIERNYTKRNETVKLVAISKLLYYIYYVFYNYRCCFHHKKIILIFSWIKAAVSTKVFYTDRITKLYALLSFDVLSLTCKRTLWYGHVLVCGIMIMIHDYNSVNGWQNIGSKTGRKVFRNFFVLFALPILKIDNNTEYNREPSLNCNYQY